MAATIHEKQIRGLKTAWLTSGKASGPILLFLHGFPDSAECWDRQIDYFSEHYQVVAPFIRGAKPSAATDDVQRYSPDAVALDVLEILAEVDPGQSRRIYCIGHDLGGVHAWHLARMMRRRLGGLMIINSLTIAQMVRRLKNPKQLMKSWYMLAFQVPHLPEYLMRKFPIYFLDVAHAAGGMHGEVRPMLGNLRGALAGPVKQYRAFFREIPRILSQPTGKRLQAPVLVVWGSDDAFLLPPTLDEMEMEAEKVTVRILAGNHWIHRNQADRVNSLLHEFIQNGEAVPV